MTDLAAYFRREAAIHKLPDLMRARLAKDATMRSERTRAGNLTRSHRAAGCGA